MSECPSDRPGVSDGRYAAVRLRPTVYCPKDRLRLCVESMVPEGHACP
jgi:hypothetical protein